MAQAYIADVAPVEKRASALAKISMAINIGFILGPFLSGALVQINYRLPINQGVGRFTKIGIPFPEFSATFVGSFEIIGGLLIVFGLFTRFVSVPFIFQMIVAVLTTKIALYLGTSPLPLPPAPPQTGAWAVLHEIRSDYAQIMTCMFLAIVGPGRLSLDYRFKK